MRFHQLTVSAFGPFAGTETVDFDDLNAGGLFLLTGPTGAGKTSVLDAICFALYGSVPGVRGVKALKSHHADPEAQPEVVLDFSISGRRFVVRRSPEWSRPKRRGSGSTTEKASASLTETTGGTEHFLTSRAQEVGLLVSGLIGMRVTQFAQVAMLPQGEFARFLRADSQDRHDVLQQLFKSDRFARIEDWVHDRSRDLRDQAGLEQTKVQRALDAVADRSGTSLPDDLSGTALVGAEPDRIRSWAAEQVAQVADRHAAAVTARDEAVAAAAQAHAAHEQATRIADAVVRRDQARAARAAAASEEAAESARATLDADARAVRCAPVLRLLTDARTTAGLATNRRADAWAAVQALGLSDITEHDPAAAPGELAGQLAALGQRVRDRAARVEALLPRERALGTARQARISDARSLESVRADIEHCRQDLASLPAEQEALREELAELATAAATVPVLDLELEAARSVLEAARQVPGCEEELTTLRDLCRDARDRAADGRDRMQNLVARRLAGMAGELAGRLAADCPCPVCGSPTHPQPAETAADAVTEAAQTEATESYHELTAQHTEAANRVVAAERRLEALREASGGRDAAQAGAVVAELELRRQAGAQAATDHGVRRARLREVDQSLADTSGRLHQLETRQAALEQALIDHDRTITQAEQELAAALGSPDAGDPAAGDLEVGYRQVGERASDDPLDVLLDRLRAALTTIEGAEHDVRTEADAHGRVVELTTQSEDTVAQEGFDSCADAEAALLEGHQRSRLEELLAARAETLARTDAALADTEVRAVGEQEAPDLSITRAALEQAEADAAAMTRHLHQQEEALAALRRHLARLDEAIAEWAPLRQEHERADSMARLVRGTGPDNYLQMRLSAYVLATRLDQVLAAANERLSQMRDQRYLLERTGKAARRNAQAGLGLQVLDSWTGEVRDPNTLSGGESFVVSLSLALGLADVVTQEAGGAEIDTLFVDEGFGTLDADTLDDVMDRLDGLRAGGRAVGVVSHVAELRGRIPTQLHVEKRRNGSTLAVRTLTA